MNAMLLVGLGGAAGAMARFALGAAVERWAGSGSAPLGWPVGVLAVNVVGCLVMGLLWAVGDGRDLHAPWRYAVLVGFLGAFTTFSAFAAEVVELGSSRGVLAAVGQVALHNGLGLGAFAAGLWLGRQVFATS